MTSKKKRQRGSRTHGGGSGKNRRGAGHRGGRGAAGRDKHEQHLHPPLGKEGFTRPEKAQREVATIEIRELDENAPLLEEKGQAEWADGGYLIDAREVVDGADTADAVKVLGGGQVRNKLAVTADEFSEAAQQKIEAEGGVVEVAGEETDNDED